MRILLVMVVMWVGCAAAVDDSGRALGVPPGAECADRSEIVGLWRAPTGFEVRFGLDATFAITGGESGRYQIDDTRVYLRFDSGRVSTEAYCVDAGTLYLGTRGALAQLE